jgi:NADH-quinone oxidoreductase subunit D
MWAWRYREEVLNICEQVTGNRNHNGMMKPGGVRRDVSAEELPAIRSMLDALDKPLNLFRDTVAQDPLIQARTKGIGILTPDQIRKFGALGPTARASGVDIDVRRDHPHAAYGLLEWDVVLESNGDIYDKIAVRIGEMFQSIRIIRQCLSRLETVLGPVDSRPKEVKPGEGIGHYEAPRGEVFHYIRSDGSNRPVRHKIRAPSFMNVPTNREAVIGETIADATIILAAVDPCYCCTERMAAVVDPTTQQVVADGKALLRLAREKTERLKIELGHQGPTLEWDL